MLTTLNLDGLLEEIVVCLVADVKRRGTLELNRWQAFCLTTWRCASGRPHEPSVESAKPLLVSEAETLFRNCIFVVRYSYHPETDSFTKQSDTPRDAAPSAPPPTLAPGSGILHHVARRRKPYRTRMIHVDMRTRNALEDVRRGAADVIYCCPRNDTASTSEIFAVSAPAPGLLDGLPLEAFEEMLEKHVRTDLPPRTSTRADLVPISISFTKEIPGELLQDLVRAPAAEDADASATGIVMASLRERHHNARATASWQWERATTDFSPVRLARAILRARHLGSLFDSYGYRDAIHREIDHLRDPQAVPPVGQTIASKAPGMAAYDLNLYRVTLRIGDGHTTYGLIRAGFTGGSRDVETKGKALCEKLGTLISSLRRWFRGTVARAHLCWDLQRSILVQVADHLAGITSFDFDSFQRSLGLLHSMLADVEVDEESPAKVIERLDLARCIEDARGALAEAVVVVPWMYRRGYRVVDASAMASGDLPLHGARSSEDGLIPRPAIYASLGNRPFHRIDESDQHHPEYAQIASAASSRDYLVTLQSFLSALLASRPTVQLLRWRASSSTVDLLDPHDAMETVTLDLPLGDLHLNWLEIVHASEKRMITLHHNHPHPLYRTRAHDHTYEPSDDKELMGILERGESLPVANSEPRAVAVVWRSADLSVPLSMALPREGQPFRRHFLATTKDPGPDAKTSRATLNASFSFAYSSILRHGYFQPDSLQRFKKGSHPARGETSTNDDHSDVVHAVATDMPFIKEYLSSQFSPEGGKIFPFGLKPLGKQLHVCPVTISSHKNPGNDKHLLLSILTDWDQKHSGDRAQLDWYAALRDHVASVVKKHHGEIVTHRTSAAHVKYESGSERKAVDLQAYDLEELAKHYDVVVLQDKPNGPAFFSSRYGKRGEALTAFQLKVLLPFVSASDRVSTVDSHQKRHFSSMRRKLEWEHTFKNHRESKYWRPVYVSGGHTSIDKYEFIAPKYIVVVAHSDEATIDETSGRGAFRLRRAIR